MVIASSEPSAQLAGSQTTAYFSFCSSLGSDVTEDFPVRVQANSSSLTVCMSQRGHARCPQHLASTQGGHSPFHSLCPPWHLSGTAQIFSGPLPALQGQGWCQHGDSQMGERSRGCHGHTVTHSQDHLLFLTSPVASMLSPTQPCHFSVDLCADLPPHRKPVIPIFFSPSLNSIDI